MSFLVATIEEERYTRWLTGDSNNSREVDSGFAV